MPGDGGRKGPKAGSLSDVGGTERMADSWDAVLEVRSLLAPRISSSTSRSVVCSRGAVRGVRLNHDESGPWVIAVALGRGEAMALGPAAGLRWRRSC